MLPRHSLALSNTHANRGAIVGVVFLSILKSALLAGSVAGFFLLLRAGSRRPAVRDASTGDLVLQCSGFLAWSMGLIAVGGPFFVGLVSFIIPFRTENDVFAMIGIGAFFLFLGGMMCAWAMMRRTRIGEQGLTSEYVFAQSQYLPWGEVTSVSFESGQEFWVHGIRGQKAMLYIWFVGVKEAVPLLREHLPETVLWNCKEIIDRFALRTGADTPKKFDNPAF
jgi:hypothetical protein